MTFEQGITGIKKLSIFVCKETYAETLQQGYEIIAVLHEVGYSKMLIYQSLMDYKEQLKEGITKEYIKDIIDWVVGYCSPQWEMKYHNRRKNGLR